MHTTRTATIASGFLTTAVTLLSLLGSSLASKEETYEDVMLENVGNVALLLYSMSKGGGTPAAADAKTIAVGQTLVFNQIETARFYVSLTASLNLVDAPELQFIGTPADER